MFPKYKGFYKRQWLYFRAFLVVWTIVLSLLAVDEIADNLTSGESFRWERLGMIAIFIAVGIAVVALGRRWFNFLAGEELCKWRYRR